MRIISNAFLFLAMGFSSLSLSAQDNTYNIASQADGNEYTHVLTTSNITTSGVVVSNTINSQIRYTSNFTKFSSDFVWKKYASTDNLTILATTGPSPNNLYIKKIEIEWGSNVTDVKDGIGILSRESVYPAESNLPSVIGNKDLRGDLIGHIDIKQEGQTAAYDFTEPIHYVALYVDTDSTTPYYVRSITIVWSDSAPEGESSQAVNLNWQNNGATLADSHTGTYALNNEYSVNLTDLNGNSVNADELIDITATCSKHSDATDCYEINGTSVTLLHAGAFTLSANLKANDNFKAEEAVLNATIAPLELSVNYKENKIDIPWSANNDGLDFNYLNINYSDPQAKSVLGELDLPKLINFKLSPDSKFAFNSQKPSSKPSTMHPTEWEYLQLFEEQNINYDGYYNPEKLNIDYIGEDSYAQLFTINVPCSGLYNLSFDLTDDNYILKNGNNSIRGINFELNIYPTLQNSYVVKKGEDEITLLPMLNSVTMSKSGEILYPYYYDESTGKNVLVGDIENAIFIIPGLYEAEMSYNFISNTRQNSGRAVSSDNFKSYSHAEGIDISNILDNSTSLHVQLTKNGASTPLLNDSESSEQIRVTANQVEVPTAVNEIVISPDELSATYYDINGMEVNGDSLEPGLYIKRVGNRTEKIIVRK